MKIFKLETAESSGNPTGEEVKNNKPDANIEVLGNEIQYEQASDTYTFSVNNPVYLSGLDSLDADGDDISYTWYIKGSDYNFNKYATPTGDKLSIVFKKTGEYEVSLKVSDGSLEDFGFKIQKIERV